MDSFFYLVMFAGAVAGGSCGLLGVYIVGLRMPFIGTCISHAAMAGMIFGAVIGINGNIAAVTAAVVTAMLLAGIRGERVRLDNNVALAILFSLMLGLTFLGMGLVESSRGEVLSLLWGSILFVKRDTAVMISVMAVVLGVFCATFNKELKVILFSRSIASVTGVHEGLVYGLFLGLCGAILTVNLKLIGGLMIFSLITAPAAAAYQVCRGHRSVVMCSILFGMASTLIGFLCSYWWDLPTGACIVVTSTMIFAAAAGYKFFAGISE